MPALFGAAVVYAFVRRAAIKRAQRLRESAKLWNGNDFYAASREHVVTTKPFRPCVNAAKKTGLMLLIMLLGACSWLSGLGWEDASDAARCASLSADVAAAEEKGDDIETLRAVTKLVAECEDEATDLFDRAAGDGD